MATRKPLVNTSGEITEISTSDQIPYQNLASGTPTTGQAPVFNGTDVTWSDVAASGGSTDWDEPSQITKPPGQIVWLSKVTTPEDITAIETPDNQVVDYGWVFTATTGTAGGITFVQSSFNDEDGEETSGLGVTNSDSTLQTLLNTCEYSYDAGGDTNMTLTLTGLVVGAKYAVQIFCVDKRSVNSGRTQGYSDPAGNVSSLVNHNTGEYIIGEFIAAASTQNITVTAVAGAEAGGSKATVVNMVILRHYHNAELSRHMGSPSGVALSGYVGTTEVFRIGTSDIRIGESALAGAPSVIGSIAIGDGALGNGAAGQIFNTAVGDNSLQSTTGMGNTALGYLAGSKISSGALNVALGCNSLGQGSAAVTGSRNIGIGQSSGHFLTSGSDNIAIGKESLYQTTTGSNNVMIGTQAGYANTAGNNVGVGYFALVSNTSGTGNTAVGYSAGGAISTASNSTFLGHNAGLAMSGANNVVIGSGAGDFSGSTGPDNVIIGKDAAGGAALTGSGNTFIGVGTGLLSTSNHSSVLIGKDSGSSLSTGNSNTLVGFAAGDNLTTGSNNIVIGANVDAQNATASDQINIGNSFKRASNGNLSLDLGSGGTTVTCNGVFDVASNKITSLANGTASTDAVNKGQLDSAIAGVSGSLTISEKTDHYTVLTADAGQLLVMNSSSNKDFTVNGSLDLTAGQQIHILRTGTGEVSVVASGATVNSPGGLRLRAQYSMATLLCLAADSYVLFGDLKV